MRSRIRAARNGRLSLERLGDRIAPAAYSWNWSNLTTPGDWSTGSNWSPAAPAGGPGAGDDVTLPAGTGGIFAMGPKTVSTLNVNNSWGKTCNLSGALSITDGGTIASGTFSNEVDVSGPGGHIVNATLSPGGLKVQNGGTVVVDTGGFSASALNVQAGGTLKMDSSLATVTITGAGFTNAGTVYGGYNGRVAWGGVGAGPPRG